jgi:hypothetical protein
MEFKCFFDKRVATQIVNIKKHRQGFAVYFKYAQVICNEFTTVVVDCVGTEEQTYWVWPLLPDGTPDTNIDPFVCVDNNQVVEALKIIKKELGA